MSGRKHNCTPKVADSCTELELVDQQAVDHANTESFQNLINAKRNCPPKSIISPTPTDARLDVKDNISLLKPLKQRFISAVWQLVAINRLHRVVQIAEVQVGSVSKSKCGEQQVPSPLSGSLKNMSTLWPFIPPLAGVCRSLRTDTKGKYARLFFRESGLQLLLRALTVVEKLQQGAQKFEYVIVEGLIASTVLSLLRHESEIEYAITSSTFELELLMADILQMYKNWLQVKTVLQILSALSRKKRSDDDTFGLAPHQVVWNVIELLRARGRERGEVSPDSHVLLVPLVVETTDDALHGGAGEHPLSLGLEPPKFYEIASFLLPTVPLPVARVALRLLRRFAASAATSLERRRARAEMSYAIYMAASAHGINQSLRKDTRQAARALRARSNTCFKTCALLWQLYRRAANVIRNGEGEINLDKVEARASAPSECFTRGSDETKMYNCSDKSSVPLQEKNGPYMNDANQAKAHDFEPSDEGEEACEILHTIDGLEADEIRDLQEEMDVARSDCVIARMSYLSAVLTSEAAASGPIVSAMAEGLMSIVLQVLQKDAKTDMCLKAPLLHENTKWQAGTAALNGALARLTFLRKASRDDDETVRWQIETNLGIDEFTVAEERLAEAHENYEELTKRAKQAQRVHESLTNHAVSKALHNLFNASDKEVQTQDSPAVLSLRNEVERLRREIRDGGKEFPNSVHELLNISLPFLQGESHPDVEYYNNSTNRRVHVLTARREMLEATRKSTANLSGLTSQAALAEVAVSRWRRRRDAAPGRMVAEINVEVEWAEAKHSSHLLCLRALRRCLPVDVSTKTSAGLQMAANELYQAHVQALVTVGAAKPTPVYPLRLCERLVLHKLLHLAVAHPDDIRRGDFLRHAHADSPHRLFEEYTVGELCAIYAAVAVAVPPSSERDVPTGTNSRESAALAQELAIRRWRLALAKALRQAEAMPGKHKTSSAPSKTMSTMSRKALVETLSKVDCLSQLSKIQLDRICECVEIQTYEPQHFIIKQGEVGDAFYIISRGNCTCTRTNEDGVSETELVRLGVNAYFGERALLRDEPRAANVKSVDAVTVLKLTRAVFNEVSASIQTSLAAEHERRVREAQPALAAFETFSRDASKLGRDVCDAAIHLGHFAYFYPTRYEIRTMRNKAAKPQRAAVEKRDALAVLELKLEQARLQRDTLTTIARATKSDNEARRRAQEASEVYRRIAAERNNAREAAQSATEEAAKHDDAIVAILAECDANDNCARWGVPVIPPFDATPKLESADARAARVTKELAFAGDKQRFASQTQEATGNDIADEPVASLDRKAKFLRNQASLLANFKGQGTQSQPKLTPRPNVSRLDVKKLPVARDLEAIFQGGLSFTKRAADKDARTRAVGKLNKDAQIFGALEDIFGGGSFPANKKCRVVGKLNPNSAICRKLECILNGKETGKANRETTAIGRLDKFSAISSKLDTLLDGRKAQLDHVCDGAKAQVSEVDKLDISDASDELADLFVRTREIQVQAAQDDDTREGSVSISGRISVQQHVEINEDASAVQGELVTNAQAEVEATIAKVKKLDVSKQAELNVKLGLLFAAKKKWRPPPPPPRTPKGRTPVLQTKNICHEPATSLDLPSERVFARSISDPS